MIYSSVTELIGKTPLLELCNFERQYGLKAKILAKLEYFNPAGSIKDRVALSMIEQAERCGELKKGGLIIEPTSGNTGIGIAAVAAARGYKVIITMPETMSEERRAFIKAYGAEVVLTEGAGGMRGAIEKAEQLKAQLDGVILSQFTNPANPAAHEKTGAEIWDDTAGNTDIFVAGVGTGGTITGAGRYLKSKNPAIKVVAVEPAASPVLSEGRSGAHKIQGIGAGFVPEILDTRIYEEVIAVEDEEALNTARRLVRTEGLLAGLSSAAALCAAAELANRKENYGKIITVIFPDSGDRYLSLI